MSKQKKLTRLSNQINPKARDLTRMDKLRAFFLEDKKLPPSLEKTLEHLQKANGLLCSGYSREQTVKFIETTEGLKRSQAYQIVRDAFELFGDVTKSSKDGLRHIATENLMQIYNHARQSKNLEVALMCWREIARINNLSNEDDNATSGQLTMNMQFNFSTDPSVLVQEQEATIPEFQIE